jgi:hypothetical protein
MTVRTIPPRALYSLLIVATLMLGIATPASAHVAASNNGVTAELHIPPLDSPVAGEQTRLEFGFEAVPDTFSTAACECALTVIQDDRAVLTASTTPGNNSESGSGVAAQVRFPKGGDYTLKFNGFADVTKQVRFSLAYQVSVSPAKKTASQPNSRTGLLLIGLCGAAALGVIIYYYLGLRTARKKL